MVMTPPGSFQGPMSPFGQGSPSPQTSIMALAAPQLMPMGAPMAPPMFGAPKPVPEAIHKLSRLSKLKNAASSHEITDEQIGKIKLRVAEGYRIDKASRSEWESQAERAMKAARQVSEKRNYPFPDSANVRYPLIAQAALQFNARAYPAICQGRNLVRASVGGDDPDGAKASRAARVSQFMSHQIVDGMPEWESSMDTLTYRLPIIGSEFKKSFWDPSLKKPQSCTISAFDLVVNQDTKSLETCPRISHRFELYPYQIEERMRDGRFLDIELSGQSESADEQHPIKFIEQHCYFDIDKDGLDEPWIVTITEDGNDLVRITAGFDPLDIAYDGDLIVRVPRVEYFTHFRFLPDPDGGFYGIGFGHLLDNMGSVIDTSFNQMLDAGHLQNAGGGFIGTGLDFQTEDEEFFFEPGKFYYVNSESNDIRGSIITMQHQGPSPVLFQLLGMMMESAKQLVSIQDILTGEATAQTVQPTTLMALIDQGLKVFTAIYKRIYDALSHEFRIQYDLNRRHLDGEKYSSYLGGQFDVGQDFAADDALVTPLADANKVTLMQRVTVSGFLMQLLDHPVLGKRLDPDAILKRVLAAAEIDDVQSIIAKPSSPGPQDQIQIEAALANIEKIKSEAQHNYALAARENSASNLNVAKASEAAAGSRPEFFVNPPV